MYNWRYSFYSIKIMVFNFILISILYGKEDCNSNDTVLPFILKQIGKSKFSSEFEKVNWKWPSCSTIAEHEIKRDKISMDKYEYSWHWINQYIKYAKVEKILNNMEKGDDWIIGKNILKTNSAFKGHFQFIDSRTLDILFTTDLIIQDNGNLHNDIIEKMSEVLKFSNFDAGDKIKITITQHNAKTVEGYLGCQIDDSYCRIPKGKDKVLFWTNGHIMIVSIPKIRTPYRDKFGYNVKWTIGGIPRNDNRSFKRFGANVKFDYEKEMLFQFPWVADSLKNWRERNMN